MHIWYMDVPTTKFVPTTYGKLLWSFRFGSVTAATCQLDDPFFERRTHDSLSICGDLRSLAPRQDQRSPSPQRLKKLQTPSDV